MIDGKTYAHKESIPTDNACRICECISGEMTCADEICEEPDDGCEQMSATKDECCVYKCEGDESSTVSSPKLSSRRHLSLDFFYTHAEAPHLRPE